MSESGTAKSADRAPVKSADRTLQLLETIARNPQGLTFTELAGRLDVPRSSLHGLLHTAVSARWLLFSEQSKRYFVGVKMWEAGQGFRRSREVSLRARQFLLEANRRLEETIQLALLDDLDVVYIDKVEGTRPLRLVSSVGTRLPAYVTAIGKVLLAGLDSGLLQQRFAGQELESFTDETITSGDRLIQVLADVRAQGYATDHGEYSPGVYCVGVPIFDATGGVIAGMSCSVSQAVVDLGEIHPGDIFKTLRAQALGASNALGYRAAD